jgi:NAD(P)-dependent dehydrogenase (short-subunit alcohol dehydrogenase family)
MGRAMALRFARAGMNVVIADVNDEAMESVASEARELGAQALSVHTDVSSDADNIALFDATIEAFGQANIVCLNAGVTGSSGRSWTLTEQDWRWSLGILLDGVTHGIRAFVPHLIEHGDGHVVITASIAGHVSSAFSSPYMVAKHGVAAAAEGLYHELRAERSDIGVTCLCPGFVNTNIIAATKAREGEETGFPKDDKGGKWLAFSEKALSGGLDPEVVGEQVYDAIVDNQFWLFTDEAWDEAIALRAHQVTNRLPPTMGHPSQG